MADASTDAVTTITLLDRVTITGPTGEVGEDLLRGPQPRLVFSHLVLQRRAPLPTERLAGVLWGEDPPASWKPALRGLIARVRTFVQVAAPTATLTTGPNGYRLILPEPVEVDVEVALRAARLAEQALGEQRLEDAVADAARAEGLARGSFLPRAEGTWVEHIDGELHDARLRALHVLGEVHLLRGEPRRAARSAAEAIEAAPLHEASHRLAMRALAAAGETAEAAQAFDRCRRLLRDLLGVSPSRQTSELLTTILRDD